ncbi:MAG: hypothetical protein J6E29_03375 [Prevotella sp.]|nr:hypothetical protein [Prevotella sp.]
MDKSDGGTIDGAAASVVAPPYGRHGLAAFFFSRKKSFQPINYKRCDQIAIIKKNFVPLSP